MKNWRPKEGWLNPYSLDNSYDTLDEFTDAGLHDIYEAGADAMLEALKAQGKFILADKVQLNDQSGNEIMFIDGEGWVVFIEESK